MGKKSNRTDIGRSRSKKRWGRMAETSEDDLDEDEESSVKFNKYPPYDPWEEAEGIGSYRGTDC